MNTPSLAANLTQARQRVGSSLFGRSVFLLAACAGLFLLVLNVFRREYYTGDEGFYGVTALNMLRSAAYWLRPSFYPEGDFLTDQNAFAHPPFNSYFYAVAFWLSQRSLASAEVLNVLSLLLLLLFSYRLLALFDVRAGRFAVLLLVASPAILALYSQLEAEPLLTTFGIMGLYCALRAGFAPGRRRFFFLSGLCLGMSFALKLWLFGPLVLAIAVAPQAGRDAFHRVPVFLHGWGRGGTRPYQVQRTDAGIGSGHSLLKPKHLLPLLTFPLGAILPAGLHLAAIWHYYPADLGFWLKNIYFGFFTGAGVSGTKTGGAGVPLEWVHPVWYYAAVLYRDHFFLLPILLLGLGALFKDDRLKGRVLWALLAGIAGLVPLSLIKVKEPLYILTCTVFLYLLAGCCLAALTRRLDAEAGITRWSWRLAGGATVALLVFVLAAFARGLLRDKITPGFVWVHTVVFSLYLLGGWWLRRQAHPVSSSRRSPSTTTVALPDARQPTGTATASSAPAAATRSGRFQWALYTACALAAVAGFAHEFLARVPRDKTIARIAQPYLAANSPKPLSLIASNYKSFQFYLFRRGCYWHEVPLTQTPETIMAGPGFAQVRAFILDCDDLQQPEVARWLPWLQAHTQEKTADLDAQLGRVSGWRLFVR